MLQSKASYRRERRDRREERNASVLVPNLEARHFMSGRVMKINTKIVLASTLRFNVSFFTKAKASYRREQRDRREWVTNASASILDLGVKHSPTEVGELDEDY